MRVFIFLFLLFQKARMTTNIGHILGMRNALKK